MIINDPSTNPFSNVDKVGIAVTANRYPNLGFQPHIAFLYAFNNEVKILHLKTHKWLANETPPDSYYWIDLGPDFSEIDKIILSAHIKKVADINGLASISYGFDVEGRGFNRITGEFFTAHPSIGLTCSTFIIEVFNSLGFSLIDPSSWPGNVKGDVTWKKRMIKIFLTNPRFNMGDEWVKQQNKNLGLRRHLPQETAAATQHTPLPAKKGEIKENAKKIKEFLLARC